MKTSKGWFVVLIAMVLVVSLWLFLSNRQQARSHSEFYASVLAQAPCIANVCPGFAGRQQAVERLSGTITLERVVDNGGAPVSFSLNRNIVTSGGGALIFSPDSFNNFEIVRKVYLKIPDLELETVLKTLGQPDRFLFISGCGMGSRVHANLFYSGRGIEIIIDYSTSWPSTQVLGNGTPISSIEYFSPTEIDSHVVESIRGDIIDSEAFDLLPSTTENDFFDQIRPWPGIDARPTPTADFCPR